ncbi:MAG: hypothetical protein M3067_04380 [Chloroflexota bacterium]|nr:hypothetical protein [Chloroflexota bacterium]
MLVSPFGALRHRARILAGGVAVALALSACNLAVPWPTASPSVGATASTSPSPSVASSASASPHGAGSPTPGADPSAVYKTIEGQVVAIRGLQPKSPVDPRILNETELKARVAEAFKRDNPPDVVAANERLLKGMGLFPRDASLADLYVELLGSQVAGFYSPDDKQLYVVSKTGTIGPVERVTFAHEYTHALQDQTFNLKALDISQIGQGDRGLARLSLVEGDAVTVQTIWTQQNLSAAETLELLQAALDPAAVQVMQKMPPVLLQTLQFPYTSGMQFIAGMQATGGWAAVNAAFRDPPASTEQILHPEKYTAHEAPVAVALPADLAGRMGSGWKLSLQDTLGEFQLGIWLRSAVDGVPAASAAVSGWGGDRVALLDGPGGAWAIAIITEWDTRADATEFADAAGRVVGRLASPSTIASTPNSKRVSVLIGSDTTVATRLDSVLGATGN